MKVVVFGGSGFLGSNVCDHLSASGHDVVIFDRVQSNWQQVNQKMFIGDLLDMDAVSAAVMGADIVYNFAGISDLDEALHKPLDTVRTNILGNANVLEAARKNGVRRYIFASSVYVFSREGGFYRCSKQSAEHYIEEYQHCYDLEYTILRYGSLYGPRSDQRNGLYRIVKSAIESGEIIYEGSADAMREYIHVEDAARASVVALGEEFRNRHVILTGQEPMKVLDLLRMLSEILGNPDGVKFIEANHSGHYIRTPYAYRPSAGLKYVPPLHVDLGQGLLQLVESVVSKIEGHSNNE
jgi:UDP-glucose 4-epimerase